jgi:hypothetical protein
MDGKKKLGTPRTRHHEAVHLNDDVWQDPRVVGSLDSCTVRPVTPMDVRTCVVYFLGKYHTTCAPRMR